MDKQTVRRIAAEAQVALDEVAARHGMTVKIGGGSFNPEGGTFTPKVTFSEGDAERKSFEQVAHLFNLTAQDYGRTFTYGGKEYTLVGLNTRAPRYPLIVERGGKRFKMPEEVLQHPALRIDAAGA